jgi:hypothetical protein
MKREYQIKTRHGFNYIVGEYCPRCGAQKLQPANYIDDNVLRCDNCAHAFSDTDFGRWNARKFKGTNFCRKKPVVEMLNPHNKQAKRQARNEIAEQRHAALAQR